MSRLVDLCELIVAGINAASLAGTLTPAVTAIRVHNLTEALENVGELAVYVMPGDVQAFPASQLQQDEEATEVMVVCSAKLSAGDAGKREMDVYCDFVQTLWSKVRAGVPAATARFAGRTTELEAEAEARQNNGLLFLRITTFTYRQIFAA